MAQKIKCWWRPPALRRATAPNDPAIEARTLQGLRSFQGQNHGGVPVGAVVLPKNDVDLFRKILVGKGLAGIRFRGMEPFPGAHDKIVAQ